VQLDLHAAVVASTTTDASLARGEVDLVIGNWLEPPGELHLGRLISDEIVCLVARPPGAPPAAAGRCSATSTANMSRRADCTPGMRWA
jgi:DNA-binding transcriptional LysR family regulator